MRRAHLNRDHNARQALFKGLVSSLIERESIETTAAKSKVVQSIFEKLLTKARAGSLHARREVQSFVQQSNLVKKLVDEIAPRYKDIKGGYTVQKPVGTRKGDRAPIVRLSLTKKVNTGNTAKAQKADKTAKVQERSKGVKPTPVPAAQAVKPSGQPVNQSAGRIGFRQGER